MDRLGALAEEGHDEGVGCSHARELHVVDVEIRDHAAEDALPDICVFPFVALQWYRQKTQSDHRCEKDCCGDSNPCEAL
ncbi:MAG: hypothetical protein WC683_16340 [bacterium]